MVEKNDRYYSLMADLREILEEEGDCLVLTALGELLSEPTEGAFSRSVVGKIISSLAELEY